MECDEEQMRCKGTSNLSDEGVGFFWWGWFVSVKSARGARFGRLAKTRPKGAGSHAISGRNRQRRFMRL
jgi:hypothetical protein